MVDLEKYKCSIITIVIITAVLMLMILIGFTIGILSEDPDGLERVLISYHSEEWLENLPSPWVPWLSWIENNYIAGIVGIILSVVFIMSIFYLIAYFKKRK